jgi:hypothetical protein
VATQQVTPYALDRERAEQRFTFPQTTGTGLDPPGHRGSPH